MKSSLLLTSVLAAVLAGPAMVQAATPVFGQTIPLASYSIDAGSEFAAGAATDGLLASVPGSGTSLADLEPGVSLSGSLYLAPTIDSPTVTASRTNGQFFEFTLSSASYLFQPQLLSFLVGKGGADGVRGWAIYSSADFFTTALASADVTASQPGLESVTVPLTGFAPADDPVTFRIYAYSPSAGQGLFFDNLAVAGVVLIPEPSAVLMGSLAAGMLALRRRRA